MENFKSTIAYYFKNFWAILVFSIIPIVFVSILLKPFKIVEFIWDYPSLTLNGLADFFVNILPFSWLLLVFWFVGLILITVFISVLFGKVETHFRVGKFSFDLMGNSLNNNFLSVLIILLLICLAYFILTLISMCLMLLVHFILAINCGLLVLSHIMICVIAMLNFGIFSWVVLLFGLACADMMIVGSPLGVALSNSFQYINKNGWEHFWVLILMLLFCAILTVLGCALNIVLLTNCLTLLFIVPFLCIYALIVVFKNNDIARYDNRHYYNISSRGL